MKVAVIGLGYIGLPTACLLAEAGHEVVGVDLDKNKIELLNAGKVPFQEKGLDKLFSKVYQSNGFRASTELVASDVYLIAVPTPDVNHKADLKFVFSALEKIVEKMKDDDLIIIESTIAPRSSVDEILPMLAKTKKRFLLSHCPERAIPGDTLREMVENPRIVGGFTPEAGEKTAALYRTFVKGDVFVTDITTAESCKVMENTFRDVNIALANEFCRISKDLDIDVWEAISLANKHPRVKILDPGPGVGGHCIPVDPWFFVGVSNEAKLIRVARERNDEMPAYVVSELVEKAKQLNIPDLVVGILGVSYKKNVDDARETPVTSIISELNEKKIKFHINDPHVSRFDYKLESLDEVLEKSNIILLVTDHDVYRNISGQDLNKMKLVFDTRNLFRDKKLSNLVVLGDHKSQL